MWGYLLSFDGVEEPLVLRRRGTCPIPGTKIGRGNGTESVPQNHYTKQENEYEKDKADKGVPAEGYLIGRHHECGTYPRQRVRYRLLTLHRPPGVEFGCIEPALPGISRKQGR